MNRAEHFNKKSILFFVQVFPGYVSCTAVIMLYKRRLFKVYFI